MAVEPIIIGTRGSELALRQAETVAQLLLRAQPQRRVAIRVVKTQADERPDTSLREFPTPGVFVKELEKALLAREITVAVHSLKDLPCALPPGLCLAACPEREDPRDALISRDDLTVERLPPGAVIGTGSPRRQAQLRHLRPDLRFVDLRGNLNTRLRKLHTEGLDALVLAAAGLHRLDRQRLITQYLPVEQCVPAAGQGALTLEAREDDRLLPLFRSLTDPSVEAVVRAERQTLADLGAGCTTPLGVYAQVRGEALEMHAALASPDGRYLRHETITGSAREPEETGRALAAALRTCGAGGPTRATAIEP